MLTDTEIRDLKEDSLHYKTLSGALKDIIINSETPLTIGVYGEWGSGKTSLMRLTYNELTSDKFENVKTNWFNAWKFDKMHDLRVALIHSVLKRIEADSPKASVKEKASALLKRVNWLGLGKTAATVAATFASPYLALLPLLSGVLADTKANENLSKLLPTDLIKEKPKGNDLELIGDFESEFRRLTIDYVGSGGRLVIFIDDLDRCTPEKAIEILEGIKLFLNVENTVFVIGTDLQVIENGIMFKYGEKSSSWSKNYLDKIIQVPFRIPPLSKKNIIESFIPNLNVSDELKSYDYIIADVIKNPRTIKRLYNNLQLESILSKARSITVEDMVLAKLNVLYFGWSDFYAEIIRHYSRNNENLLEKMEELLHTVKDSDKNVIFKKYPVLKKYTEDNDLIKFLETEPVLYQIDLEPYIHLHNISSYNENVDEEKIKYFDMGFKSYGEGDDIKTIEYNTRSIISAPDYKEAYYNRGLSCMNLRYYKRAVRDFNKVLELDENYIFAYYNRAGCYKNMKDLPRAIEDYSKVIELNPDYEPAYFERGLLKIDMKDYDGAISDFDKSIELKPDMENSYYNRAIAFLDKGDLEMSIKDNSEALKLSPDYVNAYINRGLAWKRLKNYESALKDFIEALRVDPLNKLAISHLKDLMHNFNIDKTIFKNKKDLGKLFKELKIPEQEKNLLLESL